MLYHEIWISKVQKIIKRLQIQGQCRPKKNWSYLWNCVGGEESWHQQQRQQQQPGQGERQEQIWGGSHNF